MPRESVHSCIQKHAARLQRAVSQFYNDKEGRIKANVIIRISIEPFTKEELKKFGKRKSVDKIEEKKPYVFDPMKAGWNGK